MILSALALWFAQEKIIAAAPPAPPPPAEISSPPPLRTASSRWRQGPSKFCSATRDYDLDGSPLSLGVYAPFDQNFMQLVLVRRPWGTPLREKVRVEAGPVSIDTGVIKRYLADGQEALLIDLNKDLIAQIATAPTLSVFIGNAAYAVKLDGLSAELSRMDDCHSRAWRMLGFDPAHIATIQERPTPAESPANWLRPGDYPPAAEREGREGVVAALLNITADGQVAGCSILMGSGSADLDAGSCQIYLKRARYNPARATDGKAVASPLLQRSRWQIHD